MSSTFKSVMQTALDALDEERPMTNRAAICFALIREAKDGDVRAAQLIREIAGEAEPRTIILQK